MTRSCTVHRPGQGDTSACDTDPVPVVVPRSILTIQPTLLFAAAHDTATGVESSLAMSSSARSRHSSSSIIVRVSHLSLLRPRPPLASWLALGHTPLPPEVLPHLCPLTPHLTSFYPVSMPWSMHASPRPDQKSGISVDAQDRILPRDRDGLTEACRTFLVPVLPAGANICCSTTIMNVLVPPGFCTGHV